MPSPNSTFTELVTTTLRNHRNTIADNITNNNALLRKLNQSGRKVIEDGGLTIVCGLEYAENSTYQRFSGYDILNIQQSDVLTAAEYNWKQAALNVVASGEEIRKNSGSKTRLFNLVEERITNATHTAANNMSSDIYSDGTATNQINGLQAICPDSAGGTLGGINGTTYTWWRAGVQSAASPINGGSAITLSASTFEQFIRQAYIALTRGDDKPDMIVFDNLYYDMFEGSQVSIKRYTADDTTGRSNANAGLVTIKYKNADVFFDGGSGIPSSHGYMLNTKYLKFVVHRDADWTQVEDQRPINQDAVVIPMLWMGNLICSGRKFQAVLKA
jgi:hypothetical protein